MKFENLKIWSINENSILHYYFYTLIFLSLTWRQLQKVTKIPRGKHQIQIRQLTHYKNCWWFEQLWDFAHRNEITFAVNFAKSKMIFILSAFICSKSVMETSQVPLLILNRFHTFLSIVNAAFRCILVPFEWYGRPKKCAPKSSYLKYLNT